MITKSEVIRALIVAAVVATATASVNALKDSATKADVVQALKEHGKHTHGGTARELVRQRSVDTEHGKKLAKLEALPEDVRALRARIDLLLLTAIEKERARARRAAVIVRRRARSEGMESDPLAGIEGL